MFSTQWKEDFVCTFSFLLSFVLLGDSLPGFLFDNFIVEKARHKSLSTCFKWIVLLLHPLFVGYETRLVQDDWQIQIAAIAICLINFGAHRSILFIIKANIVLN